LSLRFDLIDKPLLFTIIKHKTQTRLILLVILSFKISSSKFSDSHKLIHLLAVPVSILLHIILYDETTQMFLDSMVHMP